MYINLLPTVCVILGVASFAKAHLNCAGVQCGSSTICPQGYYMSGSHCIQGTSSCSYGGCNSGYGGCPHGYHYRDDRCERYSCPDSHIFVNGHCQMTAQPCAQSCSSGYTLIGGLCHLQSQQNCHGHTCTVCDNPCVQQSCCQERRIIEIPRTDCQTSATTTTTTTTHRPGIGQQWHTTTQRSYICPNNTKWDGQACQSANTVTSNANIDVKHFISNHNTITNPTNVNVDNKNTVFVYTADSKIVEMNGTNAEAGKSTGTNVEGGTSTGTTEIEKPQKCCTVISPRICTQTKGKWVCHNRRYSRCGSFCTHPKIYLRPVRPMQRRDYIVVPPQVSSSVSCLGEQCEYGHADCSGCATGGMCSTYCHDSGSCGNDCGFYNQQDYCSQNSGNAGCFEHDGCYEDWCSG